MQVTDYTYHASGASTGKDSAGRNAIGILPTEDGTMTLTKPDGSSTGSFAVKAYAGFALPLSAVAAASNAYFVIFGKA